MAIPCPADYNFPGCNQGFARCPAVPGAAPLRGRMGAVMRRITGETVPRVVGRIVRPRTIGVGAAAVAVALALLPAGTGAAAAGSGREARSASRSAGALTASHATPGDDDTASLDNLRTGWDPGEPGLSPSVVNGSSFGEVFSTAVKGQVYAQPLVIGSTVIVATEQDWVYGLNAGTGAIEW